MDSNELEQYKKAGEIAKKMRIFAKELIKPDMLLVEIAKKIHDEIEKLGGIEAFPVNLSIDDIAAHYHPTIDDQTKASGLLKIDMGIQIDGYIADTAFSMDLTKDKIHKDLIDSSQLALKNALELTKQNPTLTQIGKTIQDSIESKGFSPIINLSGHSIDRYKIHAGTTIPNYDNGNENILEPGVYAIEPFATTGEGKIYEGPSGNIFAIISPKNTRSPTSRKILDYVMDKYQTLPFSLREMQDKFGPMARLAIKEMENQGIVQNFSQLIEKSHKPIAQSEHTFIKMKSGEVVVTTRD